MFTSLKNSKTGMIGLTIIIVVVLASIFAPVLSPWDPGNQDIMNKMLAPGGDSSHILGTDQLGRDILTRLLYGSRITLVISFGGTFFGVLLGVTLGAVSGYYGRWVDAVIMRLVDIQLSFPFTLLAIFIAAVMGPGIRNIILIAAVSSWVRYARLVRGEILSIKEMEYIESVRALGGSNLRIIFKHILPNVVSPIIVLATLELAKIVLMEASLSYLGMGVPIDVPTWGRMLSDGRTYMVSAPWMAILPGVCIATTVLGVNLLGDWLRDYLDPKLDI